MRPRSLRFALLATALGGLTAPRGAAAQNVVLDEGTFRILHGGQQVGTETFTIRRVGSGDDAHVIANGVIQMDLPSGHRELRPLLRAAPDLSLSAYQLEVTGDQVATVAVTAADRRYVARTRSATGEREREFRGGDGTILLDQDVAHQYYFLGPALDRGGTVSVIEPRAGAQVRLDVREAGTETLDIGGQSIAARHVVLSGGGQTRDVWFDAQGRVLKVAIPSEQYTAIRTEA